MINFVPHKVLIKLISATTSSNRQDYLKAILSFELRGAKASTSAISDKLSTQARFCDGDVQGVGR